MYQLEYLKDKKYVLKLKENENIENYGEITDGYHSFNELYYHRMILFLALCKANKSISWFSRKHSDGSMYDDMFVCGINTKRGQATYHYELKYINLFRTSGIKELDYAPEWDGHTPDEAIQRILSMGEDAIV